MSALNSDTKDHKTLDLYLEYLCGDAPRLRALVTEMLDRKGDISRRGRPIFEGLLNHLQISGFRNKTKAGPTLIRPLFDLLNANSGAVIDVIKLWKETHSSEADILSSIIGNSRPKTEKTLGKLLADCVKSDTGLSEKTLNIGPICILVEKEWVRLHEGNGEEAPVAAAEIGGGEGTKTQLRLEGEEPGEPDLALFDQIITLLDSKEANSGVWEKTNSLIDRITQLKDIKLAAAVDIRRQGKLVIAIEKLDNISQVLAALELNTLDWSAEACPPEKVDEITSRIEFFHKLVADFGALEQSTESTLREKTQRSAEFIESIDAEHKTISLVLKDDQPDPPDDDPGEQTPADLAEEPKSPTEFPAPSPIEITSAEKEDLPDGKAAKSRETGSPVVSELRPEVIEKGADTEDEPTQETETLEVAHVSQKGKAGTDEHTLLWKLMDADDLTGAYWYARSIESKDDVPPVSSNILNAMITSGDVANGIPGAEFEFSALINDQDLDSATDDEKMLCAISALIPTLVTPLAGTASWISHNLSSPHNSLNPVIAAIRKFSTTGLTLVAGDVSDLIGDIEAEQAVVIAAADVKNFIKEAPSKKFGKTGGRHPAGTTFKLLTSKQGWLYENLLPATQDERAAAPDLRTTIGSKQSYKEINAIITQAERSALGKHDDLEGLAHQKLRKEVQQGLSLALQWCKAVSALDVKQRDSYHAQDRAKKVQDLVSELNREIPQALEISENLAREGVNQARTMHSLCARVMQSLNTLLEKGVTEGSAVDLPGFLSPTSINERLLLVLGISLEDDEDGNQILTDGDLETLYSLISVEQTNHDSIRAAILSKTKDEDYRWIEKMLGWLDESDVINELRDQVGFRQKESNRRLKDLMETTEDKFGEFEYSLPDEAERRREQLSGYDTVIKDPPPHGIHIGKIAEDLRQFNADVDQKSEEGLEQSRKSWSTLRNEIGAVLEPSDTDTLISEIDNAFDRKDLVIVPELIARSEQSINSGSPNPVTDFLKAFQTERDPSTDPYHLFSNSIKEISDYIGKNPRLDLLAEDISGKNLSLPTFLSRVARFPKPKRIEIKECLNTWSAFKKEISRHDSVKNSQDEHRRYIWKILTYLGFSLIPDSGVAAKNIGHDRNWSRWMVDIAEPESLISEYGSDLGKKLGLLILWDKMTPERTEAILKEGGARKPHIIFFLGALTPTYRKAFNNMRGENKNILILDEVLLLFLASAVGRRHEVFEPCTIPATRINPYRPSGLVGKELFKGREEALVKVMDLRGPSIVYGGRQMGKTNLLIRAENDFNTSRDNHAIFKDIKNIGVGGGLNEDPALIWRTIVQGLQHLFPKGSSLKRPDSVQAKVRDILTQNPSMQILLLLDEADNFLLADERSGFAQVNRFRTLQDDMAGRFKVVFAGLHNVVRFAHIPNQPFASLGEPLLVGPLKANDAKDLITVPLTAIGFRIDSRAVMKIHAITNKLPAMIQIFCHTLVDDMKPRREENPEPPWEITPDDVDDTFRKSSLQQRMRERFQLTLDLDPRYGFLIRCIMYDNLEHPERSADGRTLRELHRLATSWKSDFGQMDTALLEQCMNELEEMGVVTRIARTYHLASPNIIKILGTKKDIEEQLLELAEERNFGSTDTDSHHPVIFGATNRSVKSPLRESPLSAISGRIVFSLFDEHPKVNTIIGSDALGLQRIVAMATHVVETSSDRDIKLFPEVRTVKDAVTLRTILRGFKRTLETDQLGLVVVRLSGDSHSLSEQLNEALKARDSLHVSTLALIGQESLDAWMDIRSEERSEFEQKTHTIHQSCWTQSAMAKWLENQELSQKDLTRLENVTGGMDYCLEETLRGLRDEKENDLSKVLDTIATNLENPEAEFHKQVSLSLGLEEGSVRHDVLSHLVNLISEDESAAWTVLAEMISESMACPPTHVETQMEILMRVGAITISVENSSEDTASTDVLGKRVAVNPSIRILVGKR